MILPFFDYSAFQDLLVVPSSPIFIPRKHTVKTYALHKRDVKKRKNKNKH